MSAAGLCSPRRGSSPQREVLAVWCTPSGAIGRCRTNRYHYLPHVPPVQLPRAMFQVSLDVSLEGPPPRGTASLRPFPTYPLPAQLQVELRRSPSPCTAPGVNLFVRVAQVRAIDTRPSAGVPPALEPVETPRRSHGSVNACVCLARSQTPAPATPADPEHALASQDPRSRGQKPFNHDANETRPKPSMAPLPAPRRSLQHRVF